MSAMILVGSHPDSSCLTLVMERSPSSRRLDSTISSDLGGPHALQATLAAHSAKLNLRIKVLDFVQLGGPKWTVDRTVFEMWLGAL